MGERMRTMIVAAPYKLHVDGILAKQLSQYMDTKLVSADLAYGAKIPFLTRFRPKHAGIWPLPTKRMLNEIIRFAPDLVFTDYPAYPCWYTELYSLLHRKHIPIVTWLLGDFWREQEAFFATAPMKMKLLSPFASFTWSTGLGFSDRILAICGWLEDIVKRRYPGKSTATFYQGIDPTPWLEGDENEIPPKHPAVGILQDNNILPKVKGLLWFSEVVKVMQDVNFYIAGSGPYTPLVREAFAGLENVHFMGRLSYPEEVRRFYKSVDVYVLPSGLDCCPTTLLEASLCGQPTVASKIGGIPELVREGRTGWTVRNGDTPEWVSRLRMILQDRKLRRRMGDSARDFVMKSFSWETRAKELVTVMHETLGKSAKS